MLRRPVESALSPPIGVVYQGPIVARLARVQRLFERIQNEVRAHRRTDAPTDDATGKHVDHERHVQPTLPCRDIGEVRHPKLIWALSLELPVDPVQRARGARIGIRRANSLAANCASQAPAASSAARPCSVRPQCPPGSSASRPSAHRRPACWPARHA